MVTPARVRATLEELMALLARGEAVELIDGEIVHRAMTKPGHGRAQTKFGELLGPLNRRSGPRGPGGWWIMSEVDVLYPKTTEVFRSDVIGYRRDRHEKCPDGHPVEARPDWVCEILSPSTARYDLVPKQRTLHLHQLPHYWIADPEHSTLTVLRWSETASLRVLDAGIGDVVRAEPFEEVEVDIADLFGLE